MQACRGTSRVWFSFCYILLKHVNLGPLVSQSYSRKYGLIFPYLSESINIWIVPTINVCLRLIIQNSLQNVSAFKSFPEQMVSLLKGASTTTRCTEPCGNVAFARVDKRFRSWRRWFLGATSSTIPHTHPIHAVQAKSFRCVSHNNGYIFQRKDLRKEFFLFLLYFVRSVHFFFVSTYFFTKPLGLFFRKWLGTRRGTFRKVGTRLWACFKNLTASHSAWKMCIRTASVESVQGLLE